MRIIIILKKFLLYILYTLVIILITLNSRLLISIILDDKINNNLIIVESKEVDVKPDGQIQCKIVLSNKEVVYVNQSTCFIIKEGTIFNLKEDEEEIIND